MKVVGMSLMSWTKDKREEVKGALDFPLRN